MKLTQIIIGKGRGKLGAMVGYVVAGQQLAREYVKHVNDKDSLAQKNVRYGKFKPAIEFAALIKYFKRDLFPTAPSGKTRYSELLRQLFPAFGGTLAVPTVDLTLATLGNGGIPMTPFLTCVKKTTSQVTVTWDPDPVVPSEKPDDVLSVFLTSEDYKLVIVSTSTGIRSAGTLDVDVPTPMVGKKVRVSTALWNPEAPVAGDELASKVKLQNSFGLINLA